jgi:hypothetical protein
MAPRRAVIHEQTGYQALCAVLPYLSERDQARCRVVSPSIKHNVPPAVATEPIYAELLDALLEAVTMLRNRNHLKWLARCAAATTTS